MCYEDGHPVEGKGVGRKVMDKLCKRYGVLLNKNFAYDGDKSLFTVGSLPHDKEEFEVVLEEVSSKRTDLELFFWVGRNGSPDNSNDGNSKRMRCQSQSKSKTVKVKISDAGKIPMQCQEALRVLNIIMRQGCLLVRKSFFHDNPRNYTDIGGGVQGCRGLHSSFRVTQGGLSLNVDVSNTMVVKPGPVLDFLLQNQNVQQPNLIDWAKAERVLKSLRIKANNIEYKITGLSEKRCRTQTFLLEHGKDANGEVQSSEITVYDYFKLHEKIELHCSADLPCINVGKPKSPTYFPVESLRSSIYNYPMLQSSGINIEPGLTIVDGRSLEDPWLVVGQGEEIYPYFGRPWNFNNKKLIEPVKIEHWAIVNFSAWCDTRNLCNTLEHCAEMIGTHLNPPIQIIEEDSRFRHDPAHVRVDKMYEILKAKMPKNPPIQLLLCILPERKNSAIYGPWKRRNLVDEGVATQCIAPTKINDRYITNVLLKINAKLGGMNFSLGYIPQVSKEPTWILGMAVSHGSPGRSDVPHLLLRAAVGTQSSKVEMIASLFKPVSDIEDEGIIRELLMDFYITSGKRKPENIIIFRNGVSETQFNQVLNIELDEIIKACKHLDEKWTPKFTLIVAQKRHHTRDICEPKNNDFYMYAHAGKIGTSRPTHYHVLRNEMGFSADDLQELVYHLSFVCPVHYAHLAAAQMAQIMKFDEMSDTSSSHGGLRSVGVPQVPQPSRKCH
ncbi:Ribonuclease H-like superfamily [Sesbania bispinosa]|nr:Ribonuclease H-like superfamily [Sesbania bispinosa]